MNPLTKVKLINELNEREADLGVNESVSWHSEYRDSAWIFIGGFPYELTEGDIICVFSQYGEVVNINLVRDKKTGKSKGFCFICYEDQRSTILAVDNFNGIKIKGRTIRVDHVKDYRPPKDSEDIDDITKQLREQGCAPKVAPPPSSSSSEEDQYVIPLKKPKKDKKEKKKKKKEKKDKKKAEKESRKHSASSTSSSPHPLPVRVKEEKQDTGYDKYNQRGAPSAGQQNGQRAARENEERRRELEFEREGDKRRERDRSTERTGERKRETDKDRKRELERERDGGRRREADRNGERQREADRDRDHDRRRESERDGDRDRDHDRRREKDRERYVDRRREYDRDRSQKH